MKQSEEGFIVPVINKEKCINCGLCFKRCPQLNSVNLDARLEKPIVYAAKNKNIFDQTNSSSGGIFSILADYVIQHNGSVYGASFQDNLQLQHIRITKSEDLYKLRGSKYIQSNIRDIYKFVKEDLKNDIYVLFSGTPCQVAGLRNFLGRDYDNLIVIDLMCHGVPSQKLFDKYLLWLEEKYGSKVVEYNFRSKEKEFWGKNAKIKFADGKIKYFSDSLDPYYKAFSQGSIYRECCYTCKYANEKRVGDFTLADYWGIEKQYPDFYDKNGVSAIIVNTEKGKKIFEKIKYKLSYIESSIEDVKEYNENLKYPTKRLNIRNISYNNLSNKKFSRYIKENLKYKKELKDIIKNMIPAELKQKIKKFKKGM